MFKIIFSYCCQDKCTMLPLVENRGGAMPYPAGHRDATRGKIVKSARRLFNARGFENVSVREIMASTGLADAASTATFTSKSELYSEVLGCFFTDPEWKSCWEGVRRGSFLGGCRPASGARVLVAAAFRKTSKIPARWWRCLRTCRGVTRARSRRSERCSRRWSACWSEVRSAITSGESQRKPLRLCASAEWSWRGHS